MPILYLLVYLLSIRVSVAAIKKNYYLDTNEVELLSYRLLYSPNFKEGTFTHRCIWYVKHIAPISTYQFHCNNLEINPNITYRSTRDPLDEDQRLVDWVEYRVKKKYSEPNNIVTHIYQDSDPREYHFIDYTEVKGSLQNNYRGFYLDEYPDENGRSTQFLTTQFGPIGARYAFPSWDEPEYRSKFTIIIIRPQDYTCVISNSKLKTSTDLGNGHFEDEFEETEKISPSSVVFTISKFEISNEIYGSIHRIVARPEILKLKKHEYAESLVNRLYQELEKYLKTNCELQNMYHVALPSNRMKFETLGTYRGVNQYKERILIISNETAVDEKEKSTILISKLIAQQWFLSYLMVDTWTSVWISEGLTGYLAYNVTAKLYPDWRIEERLARDTRLSMQDDSRCCCKSLHEEARKPSEIEAKFNMITTYKGTALITMMERLLPPQVFTQGITNLIEDKKWSIYNAADLYTQYEMILKLHNYYETLNLPKEISEIMLDWESHMGYPVIKVVRNYDTYDLDYIELSQMRFHFDDSAEEAVWPVPINYAVESYPNFKNTRPTDWLTSSNAKIRIKTLKKRDWLILNNQATYYYRVHYDDTNWKAIARALMANHESIHYLNRMQIIDDAFNLAEYGMLRYSIAFHVSQYIKKERDYAPLKAMKIAWKGISKKIAGSEQYEKFQKFIKPAVEDIYKNVRKMWKPDFSNATQTMHRHHLTMELLFSWLCDLNSEKCEGRMYKLDQSLHLKLMTHFEKHKLCTAARMADANEWNRLFDKYKSLFKNSTDQTNEFNALGCSENSKILERFLNYVVASEPNKVIVAIKLLISTGVDGLNVVLRDLSIFFTSLLTLFPETEIQIILNDIGSRVTVEHQLEALVRLSNNHKKYNYVIKPCISRAKQNIEWRKKHLRSFENYLKRSAGTIIHHFNVHMIIFITISYYCKLILC